MTDIPITRQHDDDGGRYLIMRGHSTAKLTYQTRADNIRIADHTFVPEALRGQGIAGKLVEALIADARAHGFKIVPLCSYVDSAFKRHPEWSDLKA